MRDIAVTPSSSTNIRCIKVYLKHDQADVRIACLEDTSLEINGYLLFVDVAVPTLLFIQLGTSIPPLLHRIEELLPLDS